MRHGPDVEASYWPSRCWRSSSGYVAPQHWRMCKAPSRFPDDNRSYRSLEVLALYAKKCTASLDWTVYGLVVLSFTGFLRVSETVSVRRCGLRDALFYF